MDDTTSRVLSRHLVRLAVLRTGGRWETLPKGWTEQSLKEFWQTITKRAPKRPVTRCIKQMKGKIDDPGAFCAAARDRLEGKSWRSEE